MRRALFAMTGWWAWSGCVLPDYQSVGQGGGGTGGAGGGGGQSGVCTAPADPLTKNLGTPVNEEAAVDVATLDGDLIVVGYFNGTISFVPGEVHVSTGWDAFIGRFAQDGTAIWVTLVTGAEHQFPSSVAVAEDGGIFVVGSYLGEITFGTSTLPGDPVDYGAYMLHLSPDGTPEWTRTFTGPDGHAGLVGVAVGGDGIARALGYFVDTLTIEGMVTTDPSVDFLQDLFFVRYDGTGTLASQQTWTAPGEETPGSIAVAPDGSTYIAGTYSQSLGFLAPEGAAPDAVDRDAFVAKFDASGNSVWSRKYGSAGKQEGHVVLAETGGYILAASSRESVDPIDFGGISTPAPAWERSLVVARMNDDGTPRWAQAFNTATPAVDPEFVPRAAVVADDGLRIATTVRAPVLIGTDVTPNGADGSLDVLILSLGMADGVAFAHTGLAVTEDQLIDGLTKDACGVSFAGWFNTELPLPGAPTVVSTNLNAVFGRLAP